MPMNAQELIQASKYDDLMTAPKIAIAGGGTLMDWANINFYKESNEKLKKIENKKLKYLLAQKLFFFIKQY